MRLHRVLMTAAAFAAFSFNAFALDLVGLRKSGAVAEGSDGYVHAVSSAPDVGAFVSDVNAKRTAEYARISAANGQPTAVVAKLAAPAIIAKLPAGSKYQAEDGSTKTK